MANIIDISAGEKHIVGLQANGRVLALGNNEYQQCQVSEWTDIVAIAAGHKFTAGLKKNGKVVIAGELSDLTWRKAGAILRKSRRAKTICLPLTAAERSSGGETSTGNAMCKTYTTLFK